MSKTITLKVQQLDGRLAVCIPADIAAETQLVAGQFITLQIPTNPDEIHNTEKLALTFEQMLEQYDSEKFGGEVLAAPLAGREIIK